MAKKLKGLKRRKYSKSSKVLNCNVKGLLSKIVFIGSFCPFVCWKTMKCAQRPNWDSAGTEIEQATSWVSVSATVAAYVGCWGAAPLSLSFPFSVSQLFLPGLNSLGTRPDNTTPIVTISCIWFPWVKIYRSRLVDVRPTHVLVTTYWTTDRSSDWRWSIERTFFWRCLSSMCETLPGQSRSLTTATRIWLKSSLSRWHYYWVFCLATIYPNFIEINVEPFKASSRFRCYGESCLIYRLCIPRSFCQLGLDCFCEISVRWSKYCVELSVAWIRLKISRRAFHLGTICDFVHVIAHLECISSDSQVFWIA